MLPASEKLLEAMAQARGDARFETILAELRALRNTLVADAVYAKDETVLRWVQGQLQALTWFTDSADAARTILRDRHLG